MIREGVMAGVHTRLNIIRTENARIRDVVARTQQAVIAAKQLLSRPAADTFLGRRTHEADDIRAGIVERERRTLTQVSSARRIGSYSGCSCDEEETLSQPPSILVVEDEYLLAADLEQVLTDAGFVTEIVSSGEKALTLLTGGTITHRALVTDVHLRGSVSGGRLQGGSGKENRLSLSST
jgi:hypothetical protein